MKQNTYKNQYSQIEAYKESLELAHLKKKTIIVNLIMFVLAGITLYFLIQIEAEMTTLFSILTMFILLFVINIAFYSYDNDHYNYLKIAMYINTLGVFSIAITLVFKYQTPSVFTVLFLAYAVTAIYQDFKSMIISNFALFIAGSLFILRFPRIFQLVGSDQSQTFFILVFLIVFVMLLTLSSYILIKRKTFFYNQLAQIKESEVRNIELLLEVENIKTNKSLDSEQYYETLKNFTKELSKKLSIENVFSRKIDILKDLKKMSSNEILSKYPEYSLEEINQLKNMELEINNKMRMIGVKSSQSFGVEVSRNEIFSESQFKSFKHHGDNIYVRIISFVVFYTLLKIDKPYLKTLDEKVIKDVLLNSEYFYRVDRDIINIYLNNNEVFDTIVKDHLGVK
jgi:hypothetical protein